MASGTAVVATQWKNAGPRRAFHDGAKVAGETTIACRLLYHRKQGQMD